MDPYSLSVAFDDVYGLEEAPSVDTQRALLESAKAQRIAPPPMTFDVLGNAPVCCNFTVTGRHAVGVEPLRKYPMYSGLQSQFAAAIPGPKFMRVDTADSYGEFRDARRLPYAEDFDLLYSAATTDALDLDVVGALEKVRVGGSRIGLPRALRRKADAWLDGTEVLATIAVPTRHGIRYMTSGSPVIRHMDELSLAADKAGINPEDAAPHIVEAAPAVGGASLIGQLCAAYPAMLQSRHDVPVMGLLNPNADADMAALMALLQAAQAGNAQAKAEIVLLSREGLAKKVAQAEERLMQARKGRRN